MDFITPDKFKDICNNYDIIYCDNNKYKILETFSLIGLGSSKKILVTTNGDNTIDNEFINLLPDNLYKWFGTNVTINHEKIECIPLGLQPEKTIELGKNGVEIGKLKKQLFLNKKNTPPKYKVYANFAVGTNPIVREKIKQECINSKFITSDFGVDFSNYFSYNNENSLNMFYDNILNHEASICPRGNGFDTHRVYEVLYLNRIPIVFDYDLYNNLYKSCFNVIFIDDLLKLSDESFLIDQIKKVNINKISDKFLNFSFWKEKIYNTLELLKYET